MKANFKGKILTGQAARVFSKIGLAKKVKEPEIKEALEKPKPKTRRAKTVNKK